MDKNLKITGAVDENLKLVRDGDGTDTSLSLASENNGAKVTGDFQVTGYIDNIKLRSEAIVKADGNVALDSDGDLILDSGTGKFIAKKDGTEFSATDSSYAGMILGYTRIANTSSGMLDALLSLTTTMSVLQTAQGTDVSVTFVAPPIIKSYSFSNS